MKHLGTFTKKELREYIRTYKLIILLAVFILFGIMSPMFAKLMPALLSSMMDESMVNALQIGDPTQLDSYAQFFKNITQMGLIALTLVCSATLTNEISKGTLIPLLSKGLSRSTVLVSKFVSAVLLWTLCYAISFLITWLYTILLFPDMVIVNLILAVISIWLFGIFLISIILFASSFLSAGYGVLLICLLVIAMLFMINIIPDAQGYNPILLISDNFAMLNPAYDINHIWIPISITCISSLLLLWSGCYLFKKRML